MKNSIKRNATILGVMGILSISVGLSTQAFAQTTMSDTSVDISVSVQDQSIIDMVKMKIDSLSLEETKSLGSRWNMLKNAIPNTHTQIGLINWISAYIEDSIDMKGNMMYDKTIAELAISNPDLSMLVDVVTYLDLAETLNAAGNWTVFAPTNQAFANALDMLDMTADELMANPDLLKEIVMYHIVDMKITASDAMSLDYGTLVETLSGEKIRVRADGGVLIDNATVIDADMKASNGIVHVIDTLLLPPSFQEMNGMMTDRGDMNIVEVAMGNDMFTTLVAGIQAADFAEMLMMDGPYTVFAPTDKAFTMFLESNNMTADDLLSDVDTLKKVLSYHVIPGFYTSADVMSLDMKTMFETANGESVEIDPVGMVNGATIVNADIYATNGVIHVIDHVLMPSM